MASLVQPVNHCAINTIDTTTIEYYVIGSISEKYTLKYDTTCNRKISSSGELAVKDNYLRCMKDICKKRQSVICNRNSNNKS